jgi:hypothetical protein
MSEGPDSTDNVVVPIDAEGNCDSDPIRRPGFVSLCEKARSTLRVRIGTSRWILTGVQPLNLE